MKCLLLSLFLFVISTIAITYSLPPLTGLHQIGTTSLKLIDEHRHDELAPTPQKRTLLITLFYPTSETSHHHNTIANYSGPAVSSYLDSDFMLPGIFERVRTRAYLNATVADPYSPIILFSPGQGTEKELYTGIVEDLASRGYIVVAIDHTYDVPVVEFPDGDIILGIGLGPSPNDTEIEKLDYIKKIQDVRIKDTIFVLNQLAEKKVATKIPGVCEGLDTRSVGIFGQSLGGSTAADVMLADSRIKGGINMDGSFIGAAAAGASLLSSTIAPHGNANLKRPFLIMGAEGHNQTNDATWAAFWKAQTGWKRQVNVKGTVHFSYSDAAPLVKIAGIDKIIPKDIIQGFVGSIDGLRMHEIVTTYVSALFDYSLKGKKKPVLDGPNKRFPEVVFVK